MVLGSYLAFGHLKGTLARRCSVYDLGFRVQSNPSWGHVYGFLRPRTQSFQLRDPTEQLETMIRRTGTTAPRLPTEINNDDILTCHHVSI